MWAVSPVLHKQPPPLFLAVSANAQPSSSGKQRQQVRPKQQQQNIKTGAAGTHQQLTGLDVLRAMQKAAAEKSRRSNTKRNRKRDGSLSAGSQQKEGAAAAAAAANYSDVRPLCIKGEWVARLDQLEKRLEELSNAK